MHGLYYMMVNGIYYADQTRLLPLVTGVAAAVNFGANILLIPRIGMMGAAWATLVALAVMAVLTFVLAQRVYPIPFETGRIGRVLAVYLLIWGSCHAVAVASVPWSAIARVAAVLAAPALLAMTGFLRPEERSRLWAALPRIRKGR
jgi:O-antigen/teichoic acid export membrane protein